MAISLVNSNLSLQAKQLLSYLYGVMGLRDYRIRGDFFATVSSSQ